MSIKFDQQSQNQFLERKMLGSARIYKTLNRFVASTRQSTIKNSFNKWKQECAAPPKAKEDPNSKVIQLSQALNSVQSRQKHQCFTNLRLNSLQGQHELLQEISKTEQDQLHGQNQEVIEQVQSL